MNDLLSNSIITTILNGLDAMSPKNKIIGNYIIQHPNKAVFMTSKKLAETCVLSETTVIRFALSLGFKRYSEFQQALREFVNTSLTLPERADLQNADNPGLKRFHRLVIEELNEVQYLYETLDIQTVSKIVEHLAISPSIYVVGSRLSYTFAYYLGLSLTKIRKGIQTVTGSDSNAIDIFSCAPAKSLVALIATTRYPNELIKLSKLVRRLGHTLIVLTDSSISPVIQFANLSLVVPSKSIPFIANPTNMMCAIKYIIQELAYRQGPLLKEHQERLERIYLENDILFNPMI